MFNPRIWRLTRMLEHEILVILECLNLKFWTESNAWTRDFGQTRMFNHQVWNLFQMLDETRMFNPRICCLTRILELKLLVWFECSSLIVWSECSLDLKTESNVLSSRFKIISNAQSDSYPRNFNLARMYGFKILVRLKCLNSNFRLDSKIWSDSKFKLKFVVRLENLNERWKHELELSLNCGKSTL